MTTLEYYKFMVYDTPYCVWDGLQYLKHMNKYFFRSLERNYYSFILDVAKTSNNDTETESNILLRQTYHHAIETLFSIIFGYLQAPHAIPAWIYRSTRSDLDLCVKDLSTGNKLPYLAKPMQTEGWGGFCETIFKNADAEFLYSLTETLEAIAKDFQDPILRNEYNSIKHGFRISGDPMKLQIATTAEANAGDYVDLIAPKNGSSFMAVSPIVDIEGRAQKNPNFTFAMNSTGWDIEHTSIQLNKIALVIENLRRALPVLIEGHQQSIELLRLDADLSHRVDEHTHTARLTMQANLQVEHPFSKKEIRDSLLKQD